MIDPAYETEYDLDDSTPNVVFTWDFCADDEDLLDEEPPMATGENTNH